MAKETKKNENVISLMNVTEENISEQIANKNKFSEEIVKMAQENKEKEEAERQAREYARIADKATYLNLKLVATAKYQKGCAEIIAEARNKSKALLDRVSKGELTALEYDDEMTKIIDEQIKAVEKTGKALRKDLEELRNAFPASWSYNWDNPFNRLNRVIENQRS